MRKPWPPLNKKTSFLAAPYALWSLGFIIIPLFMIIYYAFTDRSGAFTLENISSVTNPVYTKALLLSLLLSGISTLLCLLLSYPLCYILSGFGRKKSPLLSLLFILPMWMNSLLRTIAWQNLLEKTGVINSMLEGMGLPPANLINNEYAVILGMVYDFIPFMILPIYNSLTDIDQDLINAARDLGANGFQTFWKVIWPLSLPGVVSGITMVFVPSLTTFVISDILGGGKILLIGNIIDQLFTFDNNWHAGSSLSLVLMIFVLLSMFSAGKTDSTPAERQSG